MTSPNPTLTELLASSRRILIFTGAGISTESGIPDFRGPHGVWKTHQPVMYADFMSSPRQRIAYWQYKCDGYTQFRDAKPNPTHHAVAELERAGKLEAVVTQNIDGLHVRGGNTPAIVVELHGSNREVECQSCGARSDPEPHFTAFRHTGEPPTCNCGGFLKPATISFGQSLRQHDLNRASAAAASCDLVVAMGSTLSVHPAASFPLIAAQRGVPYVIINRGPTDHDARSEVTLRLEGDVTHIFPVAARQAIEANP
jgi:NAD-dependent deacetylase